MDLKILRPHLDSFFFKVILQIGTRVKSLPQTHHLRCHMFYIFVALRSVRWFQKPTIPLQNFSSVSPWSVSPDETFDGPMGMEGGSALFFSPSVGIWVKVIEL